MTDRFDGAGTIVGSMEINLRWSGEHASVKRIFVSIPFMDLLEGAGWANIIMSSVKLDAISYSVLFKPFEKYRNCCWSWLRPFTITASNILFYLVCIIYTGQNFETIQFRAKINASILELIKKPIYFIV